MNPSFTPQSPTQPQQPPPSHKADLVVWRALRKFVSLVADARTRGGEDLDPQDGPTRLSGDHEEAASIPTQKVDTGGVLTSSPAEGGIRNSEGEPARLDIDKWFNLETSNVDAFKSALDTFKHVSTTFPITPVEIAIEPPTLIVQVLLSLPQPLPDDQVLILNHGDQRIRIENSPRYILLESWRVDITRRVPHDEQSLAPLNMSAAVSSGSISRPSGVTMASRGLACARCRKRKQRCDGQQPSCSNCIGAQADCQYATLPVRPRPKPQMAAGGVLAPKLARLQEQYVSLLGKVTSTPTSAPTDGDPPRIRSFYHSRSSTSGPSKTETGDEDAEILPGE
ncbi:hypothetical protein FRC00_000677 [Tulasnella sp. 408]|nr:hypothetical protein FRC00_000677 [Tulasnella sp. 408]